jgi:peptidoglycan/xylan/chitin deacetylase (PgdA/CDA1 family)
LYKTFLAFLVGFICYMSGYYGQKTEQTDGMTVTRENMQVALTFDDGPSVYTSELLTELKKLGVKASFFLLGQNITGHEEVIRQMKADGHLIGNHTYEHVSMKAVGDEKAVELIERTGNQIFEITGQYPCFVRPPYGEWKEDLEYTVCMVPVFWSVDSMDWQLQNTEAIVERVERQVEGGDIILMHDSFETSVEAAVRIVRDLREGGYEFVTVEEMVFR